MHEGSGKVASLHRLPMSAITVLFSMFTVDEKQCSCYPMLAVQCSNNYAVFFVVGH